MKLKNCLRRIGYLSSAGNVQKGDKLWRLSLVQISADRFENDIKDNQARAYYGDKCVYAAPLLTELGAHYLCATSPDISQVLTAFELLKKQKKEDL